MSDLKNLDVEWVSLVDRAAVRDPVEQSEPMRFLVWKRDDTDPSQGGHPMSKLTKELLDQLGDPVEKADTLSKLVEKSENAGQAALALDGATRLLAAHKGELTPEILSEVVKAAGLELPEAEGPSFTAKSASELINALKKADVDAEVVSEVESALEAATKKEEIDKADLPPAVREALAKAETERKEAAEEVKEAHRIAKEERDTRLEKEFVAKAEGFASLPTKAADLGPVLKEASEKLEKGSYEKLEELLKAANQGIESGELFKEQGSGGTPPPGDAFAEATRKAEEIRKADPKLSESEALEKALEDDRDLQKRYLAEVRG